MKTTANAYLNELVNYGGFAMTRAQVLADLQTRCDDEQAIGLYMLTLRPITAKHAQALIPAARFAEICRE